MNKGLLSHIDLSLLAPALILVFLSLVTLFSINVAFFWNQLIFFAVSAVVFLFFSHVNYKILGHYLVPIYIVSIVLLLLVLLVGIESRGAVRWFEFFGFRIQFSELMKPFLAVAFSASVAKNKNYSLNSFLILIGFLLPLVFLIFVQPDLGNAIIYFAVFASTLLVFGFPFRFFLASFLIAALFSPILWNFLHGYQRQRLLTFFHPTKDPLGNSYNAIQAVIAVGSGMFFGRGLGQGTQSILKFLPERHTDFIFAALSEELGFVGTVIILAVFGWLLYRIFSIFQNADDTFSRMFSLACFFIIFVQFALNLGMNVGVLPIVGVTLPFVSYGGSSLLSNFIILGILSAISASKTQDRNVLEIR